MQLRAATVKDVEEILALDGIYRDSKTTEDDVRERLSLILVGETEDAVKVRRHVQGYAEVILSHYALKSNVNPNDAYVRWFVAPSHGAELLALLEANLRGRGIATIAGTISVDPMEEQANVCRRINFWLHRSYAVARVTYGGDKGGGVRLEIGKKLDE